MRNNNSGFTLVEVLVAAIILFSALAMASEIYSSSSLFSNKARNTSQFYHESNVAITAIKSDVRYEFKQKTMQSSYEGVVLIGGTSFIWHANIISKVTRYPNLASTDIPKPRFGYYQIDVESDEEEGRGKGFTFEVFLWP
ncbi:PilW family protein [Pseudoalteromonas aurantia]|uniref:Prepilin-type cleavage/methylation domain-containing protein n=1 Tax=Pseudoalteromonas aurantia TaxID=43654 RepID=A0A5S3VD92_9GAMM|nr:type II secretion system protein [Pseudoalteromonas aurantia]TMO69996.1 hypothetical protein CWC19_03105 [Pseudoalteromonas aurantia]TMO75942.1 hypothetical protein CWC20_06715 [Pseudoalteromonas aurantia]